MHITLARSLTILGIFTYSFTALILQQTSAGLQNDLGYNVAEPTVSPTVIDSKTLLTSSVFATSSDISLPAISIDERINTGTEPGKKLHERNLGPLGQEGFNIATYLHTNPSNIEVAVTSQILAPVPSITADPSWSEELLTPTTTVIVPASTVYYTEATVTVTQTTITVTARGINALETNTAMLRLNQAPPHTFQTITRSSALASSILRQGKERRGFEEDKEACEALISSEVVNCLETKGLLVPWTTVTEVVGGATMVLVEVSMGAYRGRREAWVTGRR
ncbi:hypothetical protein BCON_0317g00070 [Botryotinia convoluta]|uniref:Uncharacterized protein n=1 Tax=Botryotinia convoluta TaxID=54673 RepID=A0A4Z1HDV7_9HELO|nr:hypothetical protein BCON_0317g00070 [Botryotinia convoluta]